MVEARVALRVAAIVKPEQVAHQKNHQQWQPTETPGILKPYQQPSPKAQATKHRHAEVMADEPGLNLFHVRGDLSQTQSFLAKGVEPGLGGDRFRQNQTTVDTPATEHGQQGRRQPKPPSSWDRTVQKSFQ